MAQLQYIVTTVSAQGFNPLRPRLNNRFLRRGLKRTFCQRSTMANPAGRALARMHV